MPIACQLYVEDAESKLADLGLTDVILRDAVLNGWHYAASCTQHDPPIFRGLSMWARATRHLRDVLRPEGWSTSNSRNYSTTISPDRSVAIAVAAGDAHTGTRKTPSTRSEKGPATVDAIRLNWLTFADVDESFPEEPLQPAKAQTWLLLHYFDEELEEIRFELSLPASMTPEGLVTEWAERIVVPPLRVADPALPEADPGPDIDVPVVRLADST